MVIYLDVLIIVNMIVDYFILLLTSKIGKCSYKIYRIIFGSVAGGLSSIYIFVPKQPVVAEIFIKLIISAVIILITFGYKKAKIFTRNVFVFMMSGFIYAGFIMAIWTIFKPRGIIINNSVVYYDISAVFLIIFSAIAYLIITVTMSLIKRQANHSKRCSVEIKCDEYTASFLGMFDTGNSVTDVFSDSQVLFLSSHAVNKLCCGKFNDTRYRILPCSTVSGDGVLEGIRCDSARVRLEGRTAILNNPIIVTAKTDFNDDFDVILNPEIIDRME